MELSDSDLGNKKIMLENIKFYLDQSGKTQKDICKDLGIAETTFSGWVRAVTYPRIDRIELMDNYFGINKSDLIESRKRLEQLKSVKIPVLGHVVAGEPLDAITDIQGYEEISQTLAKTGKFYALRIKGTSMEPFIADNEIVIVRRQNDVNNGEIAIVLINSTETTCKQIQRDNDEITLIAFNALVYSPRFYSHVLEKRREKISRIADNLVTAVDFKAPGGKLRKRGKFWGKIISLTR